MTYRAGPVGLVILCTLAGLTTPAYTQQFEPGDVIVSGAIQTGGPQEFDYKLLCYHPDGQLKTVLSNGPVFAFGWLAFSPGGVLYATSPQGLETVSASGVISHGPLYGLYAFSSFAFTADGTLLVSDGSQSISQISQFGTLLGTYVVTNGPGGSPLDVGSDQCTVYWLGAAFRGFDFCHGNQVQDRPLPDGVDFRLLPNGGTAISVFSTIEIFSANGTFVRTISGPGGKLALDPDGTSIWQAGQGTLTKFDMATGNVLVGPIQTGLPGILGLTVYGEPRAAFVNGALAAIPTLSPWMLLALCTVMAALALVRLRI
jgi:hypothetical protein